MSYWLSTVGVVGPFDSEEGEEEEKGIGTASDIVKVKGEDPATPGCLKKNRTRRYVGDSASWVCAPWSARDETPALLLCFIKPILGSHGRLLSSMGKFFFAIFFVLQIKNIRTVTYLSHPRDPRTLTHPLGGSCVSALQRTCVATHFQGWVEFVSMAFMRFTYLDLVYVLLARRMLYLMNERGIFQVM